MLVIGLLLVFQFLLGRLGFPLLGCRRLGLCLGFLFGGLLLGSRRIQLLLHCGLAGQGLFLSCPVIEGGRHIPGLAVSLGRSLQVPVFLLLGPQLNQVIDLHVIFRLLQAVINIVLSHISRLRGELPGRQIELLGLLVFLRPHGLVRQDNLLGKLDVLVRLPAGLLLF